MTILIFVFSHYKSIKKALLNAELSHEELAEQLSIARNRISELELQIIDLYKQYKELQKDKEVVANIRVDSLYYQIALLKDCNELFARVYIKDNKVSRIEAATEI